MSAFKEKLSVSDYFSLFYLYIFNVQSDQKIFKFIMLNQKKSINLEFDKTKNV